MAEFEEELDVSTPAGAREWFESVGVPYPEEKEAALVRALPEHLLHAKGMSPKERNNYLDYIRRYYSREPILTPARYRTEELLRRGVPLDQIRAMQVKPLLGTSSLLNPEAVRNIAGAVHEQAMGGISATPDTTEDIEAYGLEQAPRVWENNPLKYGARLDIKASPSQELTRRTFEDIRGKPTEYSDVIDSAATLAGTLLSPAPLGVVRAGKAAYDEFSQVNPSNFASVVKERVKNILSRPPSQKPQTKTNSGE